LTLASVRNGQLDLTRTKRVDVDASTNRLVREGCFYIVRGNGRLDLVGRAGLAPYPVSPVVFPDLLIEADIDATKIDSAYLQLVWDAREVRADLESRARTTAGIHKINLTNLAQVLVPLPDLRQQRRIAAELCERLAVIDAGEASNRAERLAIETLSAALLRRAFEGLAA
jgi:type I restriction enzyme S subunit